MARANIICPFLTHIYNLNHRHISQTNADFLCVFFNHSSVYEGYQEINACQIAIIFNFPICYKNFNVDLGVITLPKQPSQLKMKKLNAFSH